MHNSAQWCRPEEIAAQLCALGIDWIQLPEYFPSITSTSDYLLSQGQPVHGRVCIADYQTRGRGRRGRQWQASSGSSLMFSIGWQPVGPLRSEVSLIVAVALADALTSLGVPGVGLKWPNDILCEDRKLAGTLVESRICGRVTEVVIGIGVNVQHRVADMETVERPWIDLLQMGVVNPDRLRLLVDILAQLARRLDEFEAQGFAAIRQSWLDYHLYQGVTMTYQYQGKSRNGRVSGIDEQGALLLDEGGRRVTLRSGEVSSLRVVA